MIGPDPKEAGAGLRKSGIRLLESDGMGIGWKLRGIGNWDYGLYWSRTKFWCFWTKHYFKEIGRISSFQEVGEKRTSRSPRLDYSKRGGYWLESPRRRCSTVNKSEIRSNKALLCRDETWLCCLWKQGFVTWSLGDRNTWNVVCVFSAVLPTVKVVSEVVAESRFSGLYLASSGMPGTESRKRAWSPDALPIRRMAGYTEE